MPTEPTAGELLELLAAIGDTLCIDPPARAGDEDSYRRALEHRALLVQVTVENFQRDPDAFPAAASATWLREQAAKVRRDQPPDGQLRIADRVGHLKLGSRLGDVEVPGAEHCLELIADTERQSPDGRDDRELLVLQVGPQRLGQWTSGRRLAADHYG